ncbi:uncharacterized protein BDV14DRAFT_206734 [Aspergillus stella-maris]|uniref:uncharacterized protein n=1 Tax=Aspergillus stella-maris TaxID=1810926 RepID=UPI003CCCA3F9
MSLSLNLSRASKTLQFISFSLYNLPLELLLQISAYLDSPALYALSRNSRLCLHVCSLNINGTREDNLGSKLHSERSASGFITIPQDAIQRWQDVLERLVNCQSSHVPPNIFTPCDTRPLRELNLLFKASNSPKFITACSSLESLTFKLAMETEEVLFVAQIIRNATRLQRLRIDADYGEHSTTLMSHLYPYSTQLTLSIPLRELTLETAHVGSSHAFAEFLASLQHSLTKVSLTAVHLDSGDWASVLRTLSKLPLLTDISTWVLGQPEFERVHFPAILQDPVVDPVLGIKFSYAVRKLRQGQRTIMVAYSGRIVDIALQKLADFATLYSVTG